MKSAEEKKEYQRQYRIANIEKRRQYNANNASGIRKYMKQYVEDNRQEINKYQKERETRLKKYGLTLQEYNTILEKQKGVCAICKKASVVERLAVDHDHATGKVRGLLCRKCNSAIGFLGDDPLFVANALIYLNGDSSDEQ